MCNVYQRFVEDYTRIPHQLNELHKNGHPVMLEPFSNEQTHAFETLIDAVNSPAILVHSKNGLPFSVNADSSSYQEGVALFQTYHNREQKLLGFWSLFLNPHKKN